MSRQFHVLIVDDEEPLRVILESELGDTGEFSIETASDGAQAINLIQARVFDIILLDIRMPRVSGIEVLQFVHEYSPTTQVIILTNYADVRTAIETIKLGAYDFIAKPYEFDELLNTMRRAIERRRLYIDNKLMKSELSRKAGSFELVGHSQEFQKLIDNATRFAASDSFVLIQGASGTGKELIANLIHRRSPRNDRPFVAVNCASLPDALLESELFGHEKGAFTDAYEAKQGLVEVANGGTLFLDEIGDISLTIQPKLLRFLETGEFRRIGGTNQLTVDVRVLSATNKDLRAEVAAGRFREDLLYRINVITLNAPPLRDRKEDIPLLVSHFLLRKSTPRAQKSISPEALQLMQTYEWPGNVRELEHVVEGAILMSSGNTIEAPDLPPSLQRKSGKSHSLYTPEKNEVLTLDQVECIHIKHALEEFGFNRKKTADALGISKKTLYLKIKQFGISVPD
ncbi:MAG: sigma-54 dependent transcriptional regulator [Bacteroidota bacterium]